VETRRPIRSTTTTQTSPTVGFADTSPFRGRVFKRKTGGPFRSRPLHFQVALKAVIRC